MLAGTQRTLRLIGPPRTKLLLFTGRRLTGEEAVDWGLADILSDDPEEVLYECAAFQLNKLPHASNS